MILVAGSVVAVRAAEQVPPATPAQPEETLEHDTAGVILITLDDEPQAFIFVSKSGKVLATTAEVCAKQPKCGELAQRLVDEGKANVLPIHSIPKHSGTDT